MDDKKPFDEMNQNLDTIEECADKIRFVQEMLKDYSTIPIREYGAKLDYIEDNLRCIEKTADEIGKIIKVYGINEIEDKYKDNQVYKFYKEDIHKFRAAYWRFLSNHKNSLLRRYVAMAALNAPASKWPWEVEHFEKLKREQSRDNNKDITNSMSIVNRTTSSNQSGVDLGNIIKESQEQIAREREETRRKEEEERAKLDPITKEYRENPTPESIQKYINEVYYRGNRWNDGVVPTVTEFMEFMKDIYKEHRIKIAGNYNKFAHKDYNAVRYGSKLAIYDKSLDKLIKGRWPEITDHDIKIIYDELEAVDIILRRSFQITKVNNALKYSINFIGFSINRLKLYGVINWKK